MATSILGVSRNLSLISNSEHFSLCLKQCNRKIYHLRTLFCAKSKPQLSLKKLRNIFLDISFLNKPRYFHYSPYLYHLESCKEEKEEVPVEKEKFSHKALYALLQKCLTVEEQIEVFNSAVCLTEKDIRERLEVCENLQNILQPYFPECTVVLTGSSINGLGRKGCDIDMTFQYPNTVPMATKDLPSPDYVDSENISPPVIISYPPKYQLRYVRQILRRTNMFDESMEVVAAHCPLLKFTYKKIKCDLTYDNRLAINGTNVMKLCQSLDSRVAKLSKIIIYWAKNRRLMGGPAKFKSYGMFYLIVYYLQTTHPPVLPPIQDIFDKLGNPEHWSSDVYTSASFTASKNEQSIEELLREFFFFYVNFDFSAVICPLTGSLIDKSTMSKKEKFLISTICVQDPLYPEWNTTYAASYHYCKHFFKEIITVCESYQKQEAWLPHSNVWGLTSLISGNFDLVSNKETQVTFKICLDKNSLGIETSKNDQELLCLCINHIYNILNNGLLFHCEKLSNQVSLDFLKGRQVSDTTAKRTTVNDTLQLDSRILCHVKNTWFGRNNWNTINSIVPKNVLDKERDISSKLVELKKDRTELNSFVCEFESENEHRSLNLKVTLKPIHGTITTTLSIFLTDYVPKIVKILFHSDSNCR